MATSVSIEWFGEEFSQLVDEKLEVAFDAWWLLLRELSRKEASKANPGKRVKVKNARAGGNARSRTIYSSPSKPNESPRRRTGAGQKGIVGGRQGFKARVGFRRGVLYMGFHELGINYRVVGFQRRPTIVPTMMRNRSKLVMAMKNASDRVG